MNVDEFIDPKEIELQSVTGSKHKYIISRLPYLGGGRELCTQFVPTATPKVGDYKANENLSRLMFKHIAAITQDDTQVPLESDALVHNHVPDFLIGVKLEEAMLEHNMGFSVAGKMSGFLDQLKEQADQLISKILTASPEQSSVADKRHSES